jgi:uncharacterized protein YggE
MNRKPICSALLLIFAIGLTNQSRAEDNYPHPRLISVQGTAEINVAPDEAVLTLGVDSRDKVLAVAKSENDARVKKVMKLAQATGVEQKDIQTSALRMGPMYSDERVPRFLGYEVSQTIAITLKDVSKYEGLMTRLLEAGVNRVDDASFRIKEPRKYKDEARSKAIAAAREKATAMAKELGQTVGKPWEVMEQSEDGIPVIAGVPEKTRANYAYSTGEAEPEESTIAPGQVTIRASVRVSFQLE